MFSNAKRSLANLFAGLLLIVTSTVCTPNLIAQSQQASAGLVGAWSVSVTLTDCNGNVKGTFPSMLLFSRGGTLTETTFNPAFLPGQRSTGLGVWSLNDNGTYSASDVAFILYTAGIFTAGTQEITHTITLSSDASSWSDSAQVSFYSLDHTLLRSACATANAVRLQ